MRSEVRRPVVEVCDLCVEYVRRGRTGRGTELVRALSCVTMAVAAGSAVGVAGSSGCGKSTLARCLAGWLDSSSGLIRRHGEVQLVMQDPGGSLNPRFSAREIVEEPLRLRSAVIPGDMAEKALLSVGLSPSRLHDPASAFSGGERARLAVARSLAAIVSPSGALLILDESLANLDSETTSILVRLLASQRRETGLALLTISHDLGLLRACAEELIILEGGRIVESGEIAAIIASPQNQGAARLVSAMLQEAS